MLILQSEKCMLLPLPPFPDALLCPSGGCLLLSSSLLFRITSFYSFVRILLFLALRRRNMGIQVDAHVLGIIEKYEQDRFSRGAGLTNREPSFEFKEFQDKTD